MKVFASLGQLGPSATTCACHTLSQRHDIELARDVTGYSDGFMGSTNRMKVNDEVHTEVPKTDAKEPMQASIHTHSIAVKCERQTPNSDKCTRKQHKINHPWIVTEHIFNKDHHIFPFAFAPA